MAEILVQATRHHLRHQFCEIAHYEGYQYVPTTVETELGGGKRIPRYQPHPAEPSGKSWDEDKVAELYPKLAEKYEYSG